MNRLRHLGLAFLMLISAPAFAESNAAALRTVQAWIDAVNHNDLDAIVNNFASDASFFGTTTKTLVTSREGIRKYFEAVFARFAPLSVELGEVTVSELAPGSAVVTGYDKWKVTLAGKPAEGVGRLNIAVALRDGQWRIISFHRSAMPD